MNGRKSKALRRFAERLTQGAPDRYYLRGRRGNAILHARTTRGTYKALKRQLTKEGHNGHSN